MYIWKILKKFYIKIINWCRYSEKFYCSFNETNNNLLNYISFLKLLWVVIKHIKHKKYLINHGVIFKIQNQKHIYINRK